MGAQYSACERKNSITLNWHFGFFICRFMYTTFQDCMNENCKISIANPNRQNYIFRVSSYSFMDLQSFDLNAQMVADYKIIIRKNDEEFVAVGLGLGFALRPRFGGWWSSNKWCFDDGGTINYIYRFANGFSTYLAYNRGYNLSLNLDTRIYDNTMSESVEEKKEVFSFNAEFDEEEIIDGEDLIDIKLPENPDHLDKVHDFTVFRIDQEVGLLAKIEEWTVDAFAKMYKEETISQDSFAESIMVSGGNVSPEEFEELIKENNAYEVELPEEQPQDQYNKKRKQLILIFMIMIISINTRAWICWKKNSSDPSRKRLKEGLPRKNIISGGISSSFFVKLISEMIIILICK
ncbi:unnamed protein product [Moneuplotes crassus]|uniref:Uncharacterized protein n=1 Tax=Euplotes crassus TaxID=5936 RepID=A0AAD2CX67_EUPCR|nr:unnamed protein product [Moneuplotes crassus]